MHWSLAQVSRFIIFAALTLLLLVLAVPARADDGGKHEFRDCSDCPEMVVVPAGKFVMGSPATEHGRFDAEGPQHPVAIRSFALGKYDVTSEEFLIFLRETGYEPAQCDPRYGLGWSSPGRGMAYPPGGVEPPRWPAVCLNWYDAEAYIAWLNAKTGGRGGSYRLPSEAEWEYAARATTTTTRWWGDAIGVGNANCNGCGSKWEGRELAPVGSFPPNRFGLYDMLGNVWQWTDDCWNESYVGAPSDGQAWKSGDCTKRVLRGGSWSNAPEFIRSATRSRADAAGRDADYSSYAGFHVAKSLP
jgi:formylglycine-generating enzyme required for sulfatase activity